MRSLDSILNAPFRNWFIGGSSNICIRINNMLIICTIIMDSVWPSFPFWPCNLPFVFEVNSTSFLLNKLKRFNSSWIVSFICWIFSRQTLLFCNLIHWNKSLWQFFNVISNEFLFYFRSLYCHAWQESCNNYWFHKFYL